jgi:hypothetical protein
VLAESSSDLERAAVEDGKEFLAPRRVPIVGELPDYCAYVAKAARGAEHLELTVLNIELEQVDLRGGKVFEQSVERSPLHDQAASGVISPQRR